MSAQRIGAGLSVDLGLELAVLVGDIRFAQRIEASALLRISPKFHLRAFDRLARFREIDRSAEIAVSSLHRKRQGRDGDVLREERLLVRAELPGRGGVEDIVSAWQALRNMAGKLLLGIAGLQIESLRPLFCRSAFQVIVFGRRSCIAVVHLFANRAVLHEIVEAHPHKTKIHFVEILRLDLYLRPWCAPVALDFDVEALRLDVGDDVGAHLPARGIWPLRGIRGGEIMRRDKIVFIAQNAGLDRCRVCGGFRLALVLFEESVKESGKRLVSRLRRFFIESADILRTLYLRHRASVEIAVRAVELDKCVVERETPFERLVGNRAAVELNRVANGEVEERRTVLRGPCAAVEEHRPVVEFHFLKFVRMREHLLELRFERRGNLLGRPRRHLVLRRLVIELRGSRAAPAPPTRVLLVGMREAELEDGLERGWFRVDGRGERGEPVGGLFVRKLLHRVLADEKRARGVRPAPGLRRLAFDILDNIGDGARQILSLCRLDVFPCLVEIVFTHGNSILRDSSNKRHGNAHDFKVNFSHAQIIHKIPT